MGETFPQRRDVLGYLGYLVGAVTWCGCRPGSSSTGAVDRVWGRNGYGNGRFYKPRAMAIDDADQLYIVDYTARIQVFDLEGNFRRSWQTPTHKKGRPGGLAIGRDGNLLVADTHYSQLLVYQPDGTLIQDRTIGGTLGDGPGEFGQVSDAVQDTQGNIYVSEKDGRIQVFSPGGEYMAEWGSEGSGPQQFRALWNMAIDDEDQIWAVDSCNHRIQVFDACGNPLWIWGELGSEPGQFKYPYDVALDGNGHVYVCEFGNHRVQKFDLAGCHLASWGTNGRDPGQLHSPWALICDSRGRVHVLDTNNHRVQTIWL